MTPAETISLVMFDLDGTLVDAFEAVGESVNFALTEAGFEARSREVIERQVGWGERSLIESFVPEDRVEDVLRIYQEHHPAALREGARFLPGVPEVLRDLREAGFELAVASNRPIRYTELILEILQARAFFSEVVCADQVKRGKPEPDVLRDVLSRLGRTSAGAVYVGDMPIDVQTAKAAGVTSVAVLTGSWTEDEISRAGPDVILKSVRDLPVWLKKQGRGSFRGDYS